MCRFRVGCRLLTALVLAVGLAPAIASSAAEATPTPQSVETGYHPTALASLPRNDGSGAQAINDAGDIVGWSGTASESQAALWADQGATAMCAVSCGRDSVALGINDVGQAAGYVQRTGQPPQAALWADGTHTILDPLHDSAGSQAYAINAAGHVVGWSGNEFEGRAVLWDRGKLTDLGTLPGDDQSVAWAINDVGQIAGWSGRGTRMDPVQATLWADGQITDLGTLPGGSWSKAWGINDAGQIVGEAESADGGRHAVRWDRGTIQDLGTLAHGEASRAIGINEAGQIVGWSWRDVQGKPREWGRAVLWDRGRITDLGALPGDEASAALAINEAGQIVGRSGTSDGHWRAIMWTPGSSPERGERAALTAGSVTVTQAAPTLSAGGAPFTSSESGGAPDNVWTLLSSCPSTMVRHAPFSAQVRHLVRNRQSADGPVPREGDELTPIAVHAGTGEAKSGLARSRPS